ncbi:MAG: hypothetical protein J6C37_10710 [Roseburia sp.]|nr:hypothetical protein [Roseburia sp.]
MHITTLPLLSSNQATWSWQSTDERKVAYDVLCNKGLCSQFQRTVWNSIVHYLNSTLSGSEIPWDETYGTFLECLFDTSDSTSSAFTAAMFNTMVLNVNRLGIFRWNWERTNDLPGYLGRTYMRGYADYGKNSDFVYGWYIIELTEKLNKLISVLKNEADFSEFEHLTELLTYSPSEMFAAPGAFLKYVGKADSFTAAPLATAYALKISGIGTGSSYSDGELIIRPPARIEAAAAAVSKVNTKVALARRQDVQGNGYGESFSGSELTKLIYVQRLFHTEGIEAKYISELEAPRVAKLDYVGKPNSYEAAAITCIGHVLFMGAAAQGKSYDLAELRTADREVLSAAPKADSFAQSEMILRDKVLIESTNTSKSYQDSYLERKFALYLRRSIKASSYQAGELNAKVALPVEKADYTLSYLGADVAACRVQALEKAIQSTSGHEADLYTAISSALNSYPCAETQNESQLKTVLGEFFEADTKANSYAFGEITDGIPAPVCSTEKERSCNDSDLKRIPSKVLSFAEKAEGICQAKINAGNADALEGKYTSGSVIVCELELQSTIKEEWYDPVQTGSDLYIRSAYPQWQEDSNVHLDSSGVFYDTE